MCDYSLHGVKSRSAKVGDKLATRYFSTGTLGFAASEDRNMTVCVMPGTELAFTNEVKCAPNSLLFWRRRLIRHKMAIFRQINKQIIATHHDALEFPDGQVILLTSLYEGQQATVLQLPVESKTKIELGAARQSAFIA